MVVRRILALRTGSLTVATVLLGISWSFALFHVRTETYPLLWAGAMPLLAFYYFSGDRRFGTWKHLPATALSIYAVVLWQVTRGYGATGVAATGFGVIASMTAVWFGGRVLAMAAVRAAVGKTVTDRPAVARTGLGSGVARRRRLRSAATR